MLRVDSNPGLSSPRLAFLHLPGCLGGIISRICTFSSSPMHCTQIVSVFNWKFIILYLEDLLDLESYSLTSDSDIWEGRLSLVNCSLLSCLCSSSPAFRTRLPTPAHTHLSSAFSFLSLGVWRRHAIPKLVQMIFLHAAKSLAQQ